MDQPFRRHAHRLGQLCSLVALLLFNRKELKGCLPGAQGVPGQLAKAEATACRPAAVLERFPYSRADSKHPGTLCCVERAIAGGICRHLRRRHAHVHVSMPALCGPAPETRAVIWHVTSPVNSHEMRRLVTHAELGHGSHAPQQALPALPYAGVRRWCAARLQELGAQSHALSQSVDAVTMACCGTTCIIARQEESSCVSCRHV